MEDVIIDVVVNGRVLLPWEIPATVTEVIAATLTADAPPQEIEHDGIRYWWAVRPCVYP